ncbi:MAG: moderate conductance mechanosensitive channel [Ilumatobacteraceae bacterium]
MVGAPSGAVEYRQVVRSHRPLWMNRLDELHLLTPLRIAAIVVVAIILTLVMRTVINRVLGRTLGLAGAERSRAEARQRALASALKSAVVGVIWGTAVITVIGEVGINIGGVIATATIIGGAVAFGAQTLIRDLIAGLFVLAEDQYGVGDQVDLGYATGQVERITLRSVRLRDGEGRVWHMAHGNVMRVANLSKSSLALLDLEVARDTDLAVVEEVAARLGRKLGEDAAASSFMTGAPTNVGLTEVRDDRLVYRIAVPTLPGRHDEVRQAWRRLALSAFRDGDLRRPQSTAAAVSAVPPTPLAE